MSLNGHVRFHLRSYYQALFGQRSSQSPTLPSYAGTFSLARFLEVKRGHLRRMYTEMEGVQSAEHRGTWSFLCHASSFPHCPLGV